jgi:hypothetical protein
MEVESRYIRTRIWRILNRPIASREQRADSSEHRIAPGRSRQTKVFVALVVSMTAGIIFLKALGNNPPSAGAFCLSQYRQLVPVEDAISGPAVQSADRWNRIQVYYSGTKSGNIQQLALSAGLAGPKDINCHFVICNGLGDVDGQIQRTEKWEKQWPVNPVRNSIITDTTQKERISNGVNHKSPNQEPQIAKSGQTIYICVIADGKNAHPTDLQIKRTEALAEELCRRFDIQFRSIHYPSDWR